jgi:hypothetical protein
MYAYMCAATLTDTLLFIACLSFETHGRRYLKSCCSLVSLTDPRLAGTIRPTLQLLSHGFRGRRPSFCVAESPRGGSERKDYIR